MKKLLNVLYVKLEDAYLCLENENVCVRQNGEDLLKIPLLNLEGIVCFNTAASAHSLGSVRRAQDFRQLSHADGQVPGFRLRRN